MSNKFKTGDKVKVVSSKHPHRFTKPYNFLGKVGTISDYRGCDLYKVNLGGNIGDWILYESELELVKDETFPEKWYVKGGEEFKNVLIDLEEIGFEINVDGGYTDYFYYPHPDFSIKRKDLRMVWAESIKTVKSLIEITPEQFKRYVLNHNKEEKEMNKTQKISREGLGELYNNVCADWQSKIMSIISTDKFANEFEVDENLIKQAYKEANETQTVLLNKYFTKPKKKFEPFEVTIKVNTIEEAHFLFRLVNHPYPVKEAIEEISEKYNVSHNFNGVGLSNCILNSVDIFKVLEKSGQQ